MVNNNISINPEWRLARFSSRNVSDGNQTGTGKYGFGKSVCFVSISLYMNIIACLRSKRHSLKYIGVLKIGLFKRLFFVYFLGW